LLIFNKSCLINLGHEKSEKSILLIVSSQSNGTGYLLCYSIKFETLESKKRHVLSQDLVWSKKLYSTPTSCFVVEKFINELISNDETTDTKSQQSLLGVLCTSDGDIHFFDPNLTDGFASKINLDTDLAQHRKPRSSTTADDNIDAGGRIFSSPIIWRDKIFFGSRDDFSYSLRLKRLEKV